MSEIRVGTASWTDPGFVADWYPKSLRAEERLHWYAEHFDLVEINSTFYALPALTSVKRWAKETPEGFLFDVKLPKVLSRHSMQVKFLPPELRDRVEADKGVVKLTQATERLVANRLLQLLEPLRDAGKLGVFLLQMSPAFRPRTHKLSDLDTIAELFSSHPLAVELRNRDWVTRERFEETASYFRKRRLTLVLVDAPESEHFTVMPGFDCVTDQRLGYFRLHGRNAEGYIKGRSVAERFDYDYSPEEVSEIAGRLRKVDKEVERLHVIANNNRSNYAPKLAEALRKQLGLREELQRRLADRQKTKQMKLL
jgi:uncharacterized protein YecE (DUF72 family)